MKVVNLASGSDGNLTYVASDQTKLLVDVGLSCAEVVKRLKLLAISPQELDGIIVSHEHSDHTKGLDIFAGKYNVPVYAHESVWKNLGPRLMRVDAALKRTFYQQSFSIKDIAISPVEIPHDVPCFGFSFECNENKISILTDLGHTNDRILQSIEGSQIVYLESNYDKRLLSLNERYPLSLKRRIAGPYGHLSNDDAAKIVLKLALTGTRQVVLSHLSRENNSPELAYETVVKFLEQADVIEGMHIKVDVAGPNPGVCFKIS